MIGIVRMFVALIRMAMRIASWAEERVKEWWQERQSRLWKVNVSSPAGIGLRLRSTCLSRWPSGGIRTISAASCC